MSRVGFLNSVEVNAEVLAAPVLNPLMKLGKSVTVSLRERVQALLRETALTCATERRPRVVLGPIDDVQMHMRWKWAITRFLFSEDHARNVGKMFRDRQRVVAQLKQCPSGTTAVRQALW